MTSGQVATHPLNCEFGEAVPKIQQLVGSDPAFIFVDPTGWKGAAMKFIAPLVDRPRRDVLVNVMFNDVNRFKDDPRAFLRKQMEDFFGLERATS
jgi:three-Cys-motif partner protein